jgi:hypothetical protein
MSHLVRIKSKLNDKLILFKALERLKWAFVEGKCNIQDVQADIMLDKNLGFALQTDGTYELVGDPYYTNKYTKYYRHEQNLIRDLTVAYNIELATDRLNNLGFNLIEENEVDKEGKLQLIFEALD